jgi:endonuclease/exonuclease/phosphatase (EEP) superfamily protein YafD
MLALGLIVFSVLLVAVTVATLFPTGWKWVRIFDFPRLQTAMMILGAIGGVVVTIPLENLLNVGLVALLTAALVVQLWHIFPYTPLAPVQVRSAPENTNNRRIRLMISNVRMENRDGARVREIVAQADPDITIFVETDNWWDRELESLNESYPYAVRQPQDNFYGMMVYSRLPILDYEVSFLTDDNVPSIHARIALRSGDTFMLRAIHPVPPPLADTFRRDAEILIAGQQCRESDVPNIVAGDLNDVGWSRTTRLFVRTSGLVDPRVGRGLFASYHAERPWFRWPLDHIFHDPDFAVGRMELLPYIGSDHFPVLAELVYVPETRIPQRAPAPRNGDDETA